MLRARYPVLAFTTLAVVVIGYTILVGRTTTRTVRELARLQAEQTAALVEQVALANERVLRDVKRQQRRFDEILAALLADQVEANDRLRSRQETLRRWMARPYVDRALLVDGDGRIVVDERRARRPGQREPSPLEALETAELVRAARVVAAGGEAPEEEEGAFEIHPRQRVYQRVGDDACLVLVRSKAMLREISVRKALPRFLHAFEKDASVAYVAVRDPEGALVAEQRGLPADEVDRFDREIRIGDAAYMLRIDVNVDHARRVERDAMQMPLFIGVALFLAGGAALALVFRLQHAYLARERDLEARAEQDRRLASLGRLTAGVAHEIKNPLNAIRLGASRLERRHGEADRPILDAITASVASITRTVEDFMKLARDPKPAFEQVDPGAVLAEAVAQVQPMAEELSRELVVTAAGGEPARLDRARLREALVNLLRNALQASRRRVEASVRREGAALAFVICDDGPGVPPELRRELFEFFYTTKPGGTGLGLPLAHRVAEEHGGSLEVDHAPRGGARFTLTVPCA